MTAKKAGVFTLLLSSVLAGCGGPTGGNTGGGGSNPAPTVSVTASPTTITLGQSTVLTIVTTNATSCTGSGNLSGSVTCNGTVTATPSSTGSFSYTVIATGAGGSATASAAVTINPVPTPTVTMTANSATITLGQSVTLTVNSTNATSCAGAGSFSGTQPCSGTITVTPTATGTFIYTITATGPGGTSAPASVTVTVNPAPVTVTSLSVSCLPTTIVATQTSQCTPNVQGTGAFSSAVTWTITGTGTITPSGLVTGTSAGSAVVTANSAQAGYTNVSGSALVTVNPAPITVTSVTVVANPTSIANVGQTATCVATVNGTGAFSTGVTWTATNGAITSAGVFTPTAGFVGNATCTANSTQAGYTSVSGSTNVAVTASGRTPPSGSWQFTGPDGGNVTVLALDKNVPNVVYAASSFAGNGGIWRSTDSGNTWKAFITGTLLDQYPIADIAVMGNTIYVALIGSNFFKSSDGGNTWTQSTTQHPVGAMAVDALNPSTIYLSIPGQGVAKSVNSGSSWQILSGSPIIATGTVSAVLHNGLAVDPSTETIYYGTDHGFYFSSDGGTSWTQGTGFASSDVAFRDVAVSTADPTRLFAVAGTGSSTVADLYTSTNKGLVWTPLAVGLDAERVVPDLQNIKVIYLYGLQVHAVYKSSDSGVTFAASDTGMPSGSSSGSLALTGATGTLLLLPSSSTALVSLGGIGVYRSQDAAQSWAFSSSGISIWFGTAVAFDPQTPSTVYFGAENGGGIFKSTNSGVTWNNLFLGSAHALAVDPANSLHVLAAEDTRGLIESHDGGTTWQTVTSLPTPSGSAYIVGITFSPLQAGTIYISLRNGGLGVIKSTNNGQTYVTANTGLTTDQARSAVAINPANPNMVFVGTEIGLFKSSDGGNTWTLKTSDFFAMLSIDAKTTTPVIYGSVGLGIGSSAKSTDLGETWQSVPFATLIAVDPSTANSLFTTNAWSPDGGATWQQVLNGLGQTDTLDANQYGGLVAAPNGILYMVSSSNSILRFVVGP
jgi:hypothetical protein